MNTVFADTCYWIALLNPNDKLHQKALVQEKVCIQKDSQIVTSDMVLVEFLNGMSKSGKYMRQATVGMINELVNDRRVEVVPQTRLQFQNALNLYESRLDKDWSVTDCASFQIMKEKRIQESLTNDHHFEQAEFTILL